MRARSVSRQDPAPPGATQAPWATNRFPPSGRTLPYVRLFRKPELPEVSKSFHVFDIKLIDNSRYKHSPPQSNAPTRSNAEGASDSCCANAAARAPIRGVPALNLQTFSR